MKAFFWTMGGICAAAVGILVWYPRPTRPVSELAHQLEAAWTDNHTVV